MVRVIPVHNFLEQNVAQVEEPTASCIASIPESNCEFLLVAQSSHCVEVRDLSTPELGFTSSFPTVDLVSQMVHCIKGNYVATLESKLSRDNVHSSSFVRIYVNWASQERQAMRARIAGRVTPSLNRPQNSLEMIELPVNLKPSVIACCQTTGNLLVSMGNILLLHEFKIETQNLSKMKFIDFEARPWSIGLNFSPTHLQIMEDFISVMDSTRFVVFRLTNPLYDDIDHLSSLTSTTSSSNDKTTISTDLCSMEAMDNSTSIHTNKGINLIKQKNNANKQNITDKNSNPCSFLNLSAKSHKKNKCIDWNRLANDEKMELECLISEGIVDENCRPFSVNLPSICLERAGPGHILNPFILNSEDTEVCIKITSPDNGWSENYAVKNILRLKIASVNDFCRKDGNTESFTSFVLKPLYMKANNNNHGLKKSIFRSDKYKYLNGVTCLICTTQEGYIYHFNAENSDDSNPTCLTTYPFTSPVVHVALEYTVLHALTEAGLESYTLRLPHYIAKTTTQSQSFKTICPDISEPICLIGLRPFLGVQKLLSSDKYIVLLAKAENSWTLYSLKLPRPENVYYDIVNAAKNHRTSSPSTYRHLLEEAHTILRLAKDIADPHSNQTQSDSTLETLYNQSCALLGDYFIKSDSELERRLCIAYYKMSGLKPSAVLSRKSTGNAPGLVTYIIDVLMTIQSGPEADALFQGQNIVEIISNESREHLLKIILGSVVLREYGTDKLIKLLVSQTEDDYSQLALTLLYIQAEKQTLAETALHYISDKFLFSTVLDYPHLLFDEGAFDSRNRAILCFSDFSATLICHKSLVFARILTQLVEDEVLTLHKIMQVFLEYLPSRVGRDGHDAAAALQQFLETYLRTYFTKLDDKSDMNYDIALIEAFKILVRSYLGKLMQSKVYKTDNQSSEMNHWPDDDAYLFESRRPKYLDKMPPCAKDYQKIINAVDFDEFSKLNNAESIKTVRIEVLKLQALMASEFLPGECLEEVEQFLDTEQVDGDTAFRILCNRNTEAVTQILLEKCPQAVLQYAKDVYTKDTEWKLLVDLLQQEISKHNSSQESRLFFEQTMIETLKYLVEILPLKSIYYILPKGNDEALEHYTDICSRIVYAEHVKSSLMESSHQLLSTLNF
ncbi:PREDICTED: uncharacterized protein LOC105361260 [Ceratosolen solmsi marchali]|uniref:Uncharacterized protein LOC105361260 n=1 Tax=Ceratosolen solmsi marchali TaxID=326594 RepID=A0AAJ6YEN3_9HYME|nr:PREDICTED: uncharacterized protein LOC105361260 [Ceratosolen solmsi marchali]